MRLDHQIKKILSDYSPFWNIHKASEEVKLAYNNDFKELEDLIAQHIKDDNYLVKFRTGEGRYAHIPWIGIHSKKINSDATRGVYVVLLFAVNGTGVLVSIQHGTEYLGKNELIPRIKKLRNEMSSLNNRIAFKLDDIWDILPEDRKYISENGGTKKYDFSNRPTKYVYGNVIGKFIEFGRIPKNFEDNIDHILTVYNNWIKSWFFTEDQDTEYQSSVVKPKDEFPSIPGPAKKRIDLKPGRNSPPRNPIFGAIALERANYKCEYKKSHKTFVNAITKKPFVEKHHLIPMTEFDKYEQDVDHPENIYSLCSNCRQMIHYATKKEVKKIVANLYHQRLKSYQGFYKADKLQVAKNYL